MFERIKEEMARYEGLKHITDELALYKQELSELNKYGMVLIGPDAFRQGEVLNILNYFKERGFELIDLRIKKLNRTQTENLFLPTSTCTKCDNLKWWMIQDSAEQGYFCSAIFYYKDSKGTNYCLKHLNSYKGKSNPLDNSVGVVRYDYSAINVCLNLIHIPDTYGDFFKDTAPFYKISEIIAIINGASKKSNGLSNKMFELRLLSNCNEKHLFETILYKTKFRLACLLEENDELCQYYKKMYELLQNESDRQKRFLMVKDLIYTETGLLDKAEESVIKKIKNEESKCKIYKLADEMNIIRLLKIFTVPNIYKLYERDIYKELQVYGLIVDGFEKLVLNTSLIQWKE